MGTVIIERTDSKIKITMEKGGSIQSDLVSDHLLFAILEKLEEVRWGLIDIETLVRPR